MGRKPLPANVSQADPGPETRAAQALSAPETKLRRPPGRRLRLKIFAILILLGAAGALYVTYENFQVIRLARAVRRQFTARHIEEAREPLRRWLAIQPGSGEAHYYMAWAALAADQPAEAIQAIDQATKLGFDRALLGCLAAIARSRSQRFTEAEPVLEQAFREQLEPRDMIAKALAQIYLSTYRLEQAASPIERWRVLAPDDPLPYIWSNEILSRSDVNPAVLILNYRAALERDPDLGEARLGLARQLSKARRFDEARQQYLDYLKRKPDDATALVALGRDAFQQGDIEGARRYTELALKADPREQDALKDLGQIDVRAGRFHQACELLERLTRIDPFDHEIRYAYAQAIALAGDEARAKVELARATRLRLEHEEFLRLQSSRLQNPKNVGERFQVTKWMFDHGHQDEGLKWTQEILRIDPRHVPTHRLLAEYYGQRDDMGLANYHRVMAAAGQDSHGGSTNGVRAQVH